MTTPLTPSTPSTVAPTDKTVRVLRPARALIAWMDVQQAAPYLHSGRGDIPLTSEEQALVETARARMSERPLNNSANGGTVRPPGEDLADHVAALRTDAGATPYFAEGWQVNLVDLRRVCSFQPMVFTDSAVERVSDVDANDMVNLAQISLPIGTSQEFDVGFNTERRVYVVSSANPNLQVFNQPLIMNITGGPPGLKGIGFVVGIPESFISVVQYQNRFYLRDGYHRAYGFLRRGIYIVPGFVKESDRFEDLRVPQGMLRQDAFLGPRPPRLPDFLDDEVSTEIQAPAVRKVIILQALDVSVQG